MSSYLPGTDPATTTTAGLPGGSRLQSLLAQLFANRSDPTNLMPGNRPEPAVNPGLTREEFVDAVAGRRPTIGGSVNSELSESFPGTTPMIGPGGSCLLYTSDAADE